MSNLKSLSAVILARETADEALAELRVDAVIENPRSDEAAQAIEYLIENYEEVCIAARFIGDGDEAYSAAYGGIARYVSFLKAKTAAVSDMLDADFYRGKVKNDFRHTQDGVERSFIVRLSPTKASKSEGFAL